MDSIGAVWTSFVYQMLPYLAVMIFLGGLAYRIKRWLRLPRTKVLIYPTASGKLDQAVKVTGDIVLFGKVFKGSKFLWIVTYLFHGALLLLILGHIRTVVEVSWLWNVLGFTQADIERTSVALGVTAGLAIGVAALVLLLRRLTPHLRALSLFEDYFLLLLLLAVITTGNSMRLLTEVDLTEIRHYALGVLTFRPEVVVGNPLFSTHLLLAMLVLVYLPFSKLIHVISKAITDSWTMR